MTVSTVTVRMAKSRPRKNQSERSDLPCHIIKLIIITIYFLGGEGGGELGILGGKLLPLKYPR